MEKVTPKKRFKTLSKLDQYIVTGRALADLLDNKRQIKGQRHEWTGIHVTVEKLKASLIELDPATGLPTQTSVMKIKRAVANAIRRTLGSDAAFIMAIEYRDKLGAPVPPHVHVMAIKHLFQGYTRDIRTALHKVAGDSDPKTVKVSFLSPHARYKRHLERVRNEADFRRTAGYGAKNEDTRFYRSKTVLTHVPEIWDSLKAHYLKPPGPTSC